MKPLKCFVSIGVVFVALTAPGSAARAQDFYDTTVLRTIDINFHAPNWLQLLRENYASETPIPADLTVDGITYPNVGVRIRGNTSYTALPAGSEKFSLKVYMDFVDPEQELMGYSTLNFNNAFRDPTFCREVVYNNYVAQFIPNARANHVVLRLNGQNWGVYCNIQQPNKRMLRDYFINADGLRIRCLNNPNGPGLTYNGPNPSGYTGSYEIQNDGGLADPWGALIAVCYSLTYEPLPTWPNIDRLFAIDPSIWSVMLENFLTDDDSYINKGADFMVYRDPLDGRTHLFQRDANETFTQTSWSITRNFTATNKPVLSRVLAVPELRQRYMAHYRTARSDLNWNYFGPIFLAHRDLIDAAVQADPKKLYSYTLFRQNFTSTVYMPYPGLAGGNIIGLQQFVEQRASFLNTNAELAATGPTINWVQASNSNPQPGEPVTITASVTPAGNPISKVELFYRPNPNVVYQRLLMTSAGGGQYTALLPVTGAPGQRVAYYVAATASNSYSSLSFLPKLAERGPRFVEYALGGWNGMRITEWMYQGNSGEFVEFTNLSSEPIDMTGWSLDDNHGVPGAFSLSAFGVVQPGESVIVTENLVSTFRAAWGLGPEVKIIGQLGTVGGNNFGRNDQINLYNAAYQLVDRLDYGDQTYPGSIRTQTRSGQTCLETIGQNNVYGWQLSALGDRYGSFAAFSGDIGTPGSYNVPPCCVAPSIIAHPTPQYACPSVPAPFSVVAGGTESLSYEWQIERTPGAWSPLGTQPIALPCGGWAWAVNPTASQTQVAVTPCPGVQDYSIRCVVTNACGSAASNPVLLKVWQSCLMGDVNCDGVVNAFDIDAFVLALTDPAGYAAAYPACYPRNGDIDCNGVVNAFDIDPFIMCLTSGCPQCP